MIRIKDILSNQPLYAKYKGNVISVFIAQNSRDEIIKLYFTQKKRLEKHQQDIHAIKPLTSFVQVSKFVNNIDVLVNDTTEAIPVNHLYTSEHGAHHSLERDRLYNPNYQANNNYTFTYWGLR